MDDEIHIDFRMEPFDRPRRILEPYLRERFGLKIHSVPPNGNCFYHAVAHQLSIHGTEIDHESVRYRIATYLRDHGSQFSNPPSPEEISSTFETGTWAGNFQVIAATQEFKYVYSIVYLNITYYRT